MTQLGEHLDVSTYKYDGYRAIKVRAGHKGTERIVPPAGEEYAFDRDVWRREVEVMVSPTGRSVRVYVDGVEFKP